MKYLNANNAQGLHESACEAFVTAVEMAERGKSILSKIESIILSQNKMRELTTIELCSPNDCQWRPPIATDTFRKIVEAELEKQLTDLREEFNRFKL